jgi:DnaJ homologue, subfamily C, member 28, conserved domain
MAWQRDPERPDPTEPSRQKLRETLVERQIREAMDDGRFDGLPYQGEPLMFEDDSLAGDRAIAHRLLKNAGIAPAWIEADKHARALLDERDRLLERAPGLSRFARSRARTELRRVVEGANRAILRVNIDAPTDRQQRQLLDLDVELARFDRALRGGSEVQEPRS